MWDRPMRTVKNSLPTPCRDKRPSLNAHNSRSDSGHHFWKGVGERRGDQLARVQTSHADLVCYGKTMLARENFDGPHVWHNRRTALPRAARNIPRKVACPLFTLSPVFSVDVCPMLAFGGERSKSAETRGKQLSKPWRYAHL